MKIIEKKRHIIRKAVYLCLILFFIWITLDNALIHTTYTTVQLKGLPDSFSGYRIVQVSDLHNNLYGPGQSYLISCIKAAKPDIIVVTGDLIDRNTHDVDNAMAFISRAAEQPSRGDDLAVMMVPSSSSMAAAVCPLSSCLAAAATVTRR